jgi:hypothetical protein
VAVRQKPVSGFANPKRHFTCCCTSCVTGCCRESFSDIVSCYADICKRIASGASTHTPKLNSNGTRNGNIISKSNFVVAEIKTKPEVWIDEEIFAATIRQLLQAFLKMPATRVNVDVHKTAAAGGELVAITNTFVSQPWKKWLYMAFPNMCQVSEGNSPRVQLV